MNNSKQITISARLVSHSLEGARQTAGFDVDRLLRKCQISRKTLNSASARIPVDKVVMLIRYCSGAMNDEFNGLHEKPAPVGYFRFVARSAVHAKTLGEALQRCVEFYNLFENSIHYIFDMSRHQPELILERIPGHRILDNYAIESLLTIFHRFAGWLGNDRIILNQVKLDFEPGDYKREYEYMFYGAPVLFNQNYSGFSFDHTYLDHPIVQDETSVNSYVDRAPLDIFLPLNAGGELTLVVRNWVRDKFAKNDLAPSLNQLASEMQINPQTLRRKLKSENTNYQLIKTQVRRDIAVHQLGKAENSIALVAEKSGYAEPSAFIRAFKTWTGFTPLQFRKGLKIVDPI